MDGFNATKELLWKEFGTAKEMVMATSFQDQVTARTMSLVVHDEKLYFISDQNTQKMTQLQNNPRTALCLDGTRLTGQVSFKGHPTADANQAVAKLHEAAFPFWFNRFKNNPDAVLVEFQPETCSFMIPQEGAPPKFYTLDFVQASGGERSH